MQELVNCSRERKGLMAKMVSGSCVGVRQDSGKKRCYGWETDKRRDRALS